VTVFANGCVQTGGSGRTWKRYVDPRGPNAERLYHGLVEIPGATAHLVRIQTILGRELTVQRGVDPSLYFLTLGYEDDGYSDNGYWGHDDGTGDQCKGVGPAWVMITIAHGIARDPVVVPAPAPRPVGPGRPPPASIPPPAKPAAIAFDPDHEVIPSTQRKVPLAIRLLDQKGNPLSAIDGIHKIHLSSSTDAGIASFDPETLTLSQSHPLGNSDMSLKMLPAAGEILIQAEDQEHDLMSGRKTITIESRIKAVTITGAGQVSSFGGRYPIEIHLTDKDGQQLAADWDRKVTLSRARGTLSTNEVTVQYNGSHATIAYWPPWSLGDGTDKIIAESPGLKPGELPIKIALSTYMLVACAGLGGVLGSLARETYKGQFKQIIPKWGKEGISVGASGNMVFGSLFGVVLFQGAKLGLVATSLVPKLANPGMPVAQTYTFAFFFGVLGGFGGIVVLSRLFQKVLPDQQKNHPKPPQEAS